MTGSGNSVPLGPFVGGLNTKSDQSALADNELYVCENFEIDFDGSLRSRPAILDDPADLPLDASGTGQGTLLGYYQSPAGTTFLIASDGNSRTYAFNGTSWAQITNALSASAATQFNGKLWLASNTSGQNGGSWDGTTFTANANMPQGVTMTSYRGLLYIGSSTGSTNPGRMYYSNSLAAAQFWPTAQNFVDVGYGDGQGINAIVQLANTLLVMRSGSLWNYSWATTPAGSSITPVDPSIGLDNPQAVAVLAGIVYFQHELKAYSYINGRVSQLNERVNFIANTTNGFNRPLATSVFGNRIIFSFYDQMYVYSTETFTWSSWTSPVYGGIGKLLQRTGFRDRFAFAYTASSLSVAAGAGRVMKTLSINEGIATDAGENFACTMVTKVFDYGSVSQYKRLFWWGLDALFRSQVAATVVPVSFQSVVTWGQLLGKTWGSVLNNTWGQPATASLSVTSNRGAAGTGPQRKFVKMSKSLRFRQAYYRVVIQTDGTSSTAPVKVFGLSTFARVGERASKTIS